MNSDQKTILGAAVVGLLLIIILLISIWQLTEKSKQVLLDRPADGSGLHHDSYNQRHLPLNLDYREIEQIYDLLKVSYDGRFSQTQLMEGLKRGLVQALDDPYTTYYNSQETAQLRQSLTTDTEFEGIGVVIGVDEAGRPVVVSPLKGSPAAAAGLLPRDRILAVDGQPAIGISLDQLSGLLQGPAGSAVEISLGRANQVIEVTIVRELIHVSSLDYEIRNRTGFLTVSSFNDDLIDHLNRIDHRLTPADIDGLVLDLRGNPGGVVEAAQGLASYWLGPDQVLFQQSFDGQAIEPALVGSYSARIQKRPVWDQLPTVVLIDQGSASASEIVAAALRDYGLATLVGQTSFGKGAVQILYPLNDEIIKVTASHWLTVKGQAIDGQGISPDIEVVNQPGGPDSQLERALELLPGRSNSQIQTKTG